MTQDERLMAYIKSLDPRRPHLLMVKMDRGGHPEWWAEQGTVMGLRTDPAPTDTPPAATGPAPEPPAE